MASFDAIAGADDDDDDRRSSCCIFFAPATDDDYGCEVVLVITIARVQITQGATFSTSTIKDRKPGKEKCTCPTEEHEE